MANTALITGASSGIGREFARYHATKGGDLIIVARRKDALVALKHELEAKHKISVTVIAADIGSSEAASAVCQQIKDAGMSVDILINNAGFGGRGIHIDRALADEIAMINLNIAALVTMTHTIGARMVEQGHGKILNIGSTAGMMPGPLQAVYFATKAFVNSFSQAIDEELREKGVTCTLITPGGVRTELIELADINDTSFAKNAKSPESCAKIGYDAMLAGKLHVVNDAGLGLVTGWILPLLPRRRVLKMVRGMLTK